MAKKDDQVPTEDSTVDEAGLPNGTVSETPDENDADGGASEQVDENLGSVQEVQSRSDGPNEDVVAASDEEKADAAEAPADPDDQEEDNPEASTQVGEAGGPMSKEEKAAEKHPDKAKETNPVGEATQGESLDPYATGHTIANPEPNNGLGEDAEKGREKLDEEEAKEEDRLDEASASTVAEGQKSGANKT